MDPKIFSKSAFYDAIHKHCDGYRRLKVPQRVFFTVYIVSWQRRVLRSAGYSKGPEKDINICEKKGFRFDDAECPGG